MGRTSTTRLTNPASTNKFNFLEGVALNATEATRTVTVELGGRWDKLRLALFLSRTAATSVVVTPSVSLDGTNFAPMTSRSISGGASTVSELVETKSVSGDDEFHLEYDVKGLESVKFVLSGASAGGSDLIDAQLTLSSES